MQCCRRPITMLFHRTHSVLAQSLRRKSAAIAAAVHQFEDLPTPRALPLIGTTLSLIAAGSTPNLHKYVDKRHQQLGPIYRESLGPVHAVFLSDPEEMRAVFAQEGRYPGHVLPDAWVAYNQIYGCPRGLFFMDGPNWWHHRKIMNGHLLKGDLTWIEEACDCVSDGLIERLRGIPANTEYQDLEATLYRWSLDIMVAVLIGAKHFQKHHRELDQELTQLASTLHLVFQTSAKLALIPSGFASKFKIPAWRRFVKSVDDALNGANRLIAHLSSQDLEGSDGLLPKLLNEQINPADINRIIADLILAAGDTTAYAMEWMLYLMGKNRSHQEDLRSHPEISRYVLRETLRLYPVAPFLTRILPEDSVLCGYQVPKGSLIVLSIFTSGRDHKYFTDPLVFEPRRWDRDNNRDYNAGMQKASLPFAMGLRSCIGKKIAETQLQMTLLKVVKGFNVEVCNEDDVGITMKMVAVPEKPIRLKFHQL